MTITHKRKYDNNWELVIADAEGEVAALRQRIRQLKASIWMFRRNMEEGETIPKGLKRVRKQCQE